MTNEREAIAPDERDWSDPCVDPECCIRKMDADEIALLLHEEAQCACGQVENIPYLAVQICERVERQGWKSLTLLEIAARLADEQSENWALGSSGYAASTRIAELIRSLLSPNPPTGDEAELVARLRYVGAILTANKHKFAVPDHIPQKVAAINEAADTITRQAAIIEGMRGKD